jgi:plastocyanin
VQGGTIAFTARGFESEPTGLSQHGLAAFAKLGDASHEPFHSLEVPTMRLALLAFAFLAFFAPRASAETVTVDQIGFYFSPREVVVNPGDTVKWVWHDGSHTVTEGTDGIINGNEAWTSALNSGTQTFQLTFTPAFLSANPRPGGRYNYFCSPHFSIGMTGAITVVTPASGTAYCFGDGSGTACPCGNNVTTPTGCKNSDLRSARLRALGTPSIANDTFVLSMSGTTEGGSVLLFQGTTQVNGGAGALFGDGLRCAGGSVLRLGIETIAFGYTTYPQAGDLTVSVKGAITAGQTRTYQAWYRDAPSTCTSAHYNTSNGLSVLWQP